MTDHPLIGKTFTVKFRGRLLPMIVEKVVGGTAHCTSLDLKWTGRFLVEDIERALKERTA